MPNKPDGTSSASVVAVDAKSAAELRDRVAREQLAKQTVRHERETLTISGVEMTMPFNLSVACQKICASGAETVTALKQKHLEAIEKIVRSGFEMCAKHLNEFSESSEISRLNNEARVGEGIHLSDHLTKIFALGVRANRVSGGSFDLGFVPLRDYLTQLVKSKGGKQVLTEDEQRRALEIARDHNFEHGFTFNEREKTIIKRLAEGRIGISSISKGYTVDFVIEGLEAAGYVNAMFEWAGDVRAIGTNEQNKPWSVGIIVPPSISDLEQGRKPHLDHNTRKYLRTCTLSDAAIATSGDYEYHLIGRITNLCHMKDGTLLEANEDHLAQVSVVSTSCAVADVLATTLLFKKSVSNARWWLTQWRSVRHPILDYTFFVRGGEVMARKHEVAAEAAEVHHARIRNNLPARVIVVGGGLAGLSAAIEAASCNASVIIMEKTATLGGNSAKATSGINGWGTRMQGALDIEDDGRFFERDTFKSGKGGICDIGLVRALSSHSADALHWLSSETNLDFRVVAQLGGHSRRRTHRVADTPDGEPVPVGFTIMQKLRQKIETDYSDRITVMTNTNVTGLLNDSKVGDDHVRRVRVTGIKFRTSDEPDSEEHLRADAVILATGGYSNDHTESSLLSEFTPHLFRKVPTTNGAFATGDGVKMAREVGATLQDMDKVQLHPTGFIDPSNPTASTKYLGPEALRGSGGILLAPSGERFVNELGLRSEVSSAIQALGNSYPKSNGLPYAYIVLNRKAVELFGPSQLAFYRNQAKLVQTARTLDEVASMIGAPDAATVRNTIQEYSMACQNKKCPKTGKTAFPCMWSGNDAEDGPYEVAVVTPCVHYTMGGVTISPAAEVQIVDHILSKIPHQHARLGRSRPIRGLFAAGEVTSGVHGANRLGGNSLLECVVFGRIAGDRAASILQRHSHALNSTSWTWTTVREIREGTQEFGRGARVIRFNFPGSQQPSGLHVGQFVSIRGEWDGQQLLGHYSPITLPNDVGVIGLLVRVDKGPLREWLSALQPGDAVEMKSGGGLKIDRHLGERCFLFEGMKIRKLGLIAGGTGVAPMLQIIRASLKSPFREHLHGVRLIYASETFDELTYENFLHTHEKYSHGKFKYNLVLNNPPAGWTGGVGFVDDAVLRKYLFPPAEDHLIVICGPPVMQLIVKRVCVNVLGHKPQLVRTVDEQPSQSKALNGSKL